MINNTRQPYRIKKKKPISKVIFNKIFKSKFIWFFIGLLIIFLGSIYFLYFSSVFQIKSIVIDKGQVVEGIGQKNISESVLTDINKIIDQASNNKFLFIKTRSILLFDSNKVRQNILNTFPELELVKVGKELPSTLNTSLKRRVGVVNWVANDKYFLLDKNGVVFENGFTDGLTPLADYMLQNQNIILGNKVIDPNLLSKILLLDDKLKNTLKISLDNVSIISNDRINVKTTVGWEVYFNPEGDLNWQVEKLSSLLQKEIPLSRMKDLEYIELRFGNLAPYKYKQ